MIYLLSNNYQKRNHVFDHIFNNKILHLHKHVASLEEIDEFLHAGGARVDGVTQRHLDGSHVRTGREHEHVGELDRVTGHCLKLVRIRQLVELYQTQSPQVNTVV